MQNHPIQSTSQKTLFRGFASLFVATLWTHACSQSASNGQIVEKTLVPPPSGTYEEYLASRKKFYESELAEAKLEGVSVNIPQVVSSPQLWKERQAECGQVQCFKIKYMSDGLKVAGYLWVPKDIGTKKMPLVIFNRGGNQDSSPVGPWGRYYRFALQGFVVMASQYRGNMGGEGREEFGGADVHDILNLVPAAKSLGYVDMDNVFLFGWSRGGMMTYLALKEGMKVNAVAVGGGLADLFITRKLRPTMGTDVFATLIPRYKERGDEALRERSAVYWPEKITAPVLILQGGADWRNDASVSLELAQKLLAARKPFELVIYDGDDHGLSINRDEADERAVRWFRKHMKTAG